VELRNQAEQLGYQATNTLKDLGDKVSAEDRAAVESQVAALEEARKGSDLTAIQTHMTTLIETLSRVSTAAYKAASDAAGSGAGAGPSGDAGAPGSGSAGSAGSAGSQGGPAADDTVEGEFKEM
jgi:molecular chaperone DnaK